MEFVHETASAAQSVAETGSGGESVDEGRVEVGDSGPTIGYRQLQPDPAGSPNGLELEGPPPCPWM